MKKILTGAYLIVHSFAILTSAVDGCFIVRDRSVIRSKTATSAAACAASAAASAATCTSAAFVGSPDGAGGKEYQYSKYDDHDQIAKYRGHVVTSFFMIYFP